MKLAVLSNINADSLIRRLSKSFTIFKPSGFGTWVKELGSTTSELFQFKPDAIFLLFDGEEMIRNQNSEEFIKSELANWFALIEKSIVENPSITFFVSNIDIPLKRILPMKAEKWEKRIVDYWAGKVQELQNTNNNCSLFDLCNIIFEIGRNQFYSPKLWYLAGMRMSMKGESLICVEIERCIRGIQGIRKKCLVLDLDNTLWGGVIGEDGLNGIDLSEYQKGARYKDFQKRIRELKQIGVLITIASKNNTEDVLEVLSRHPHMVLHEGDFVSMKINWNLKSESIRELSEDLNLGLDSFVFIDDNPIERGSVKKELPEVTVPEFPEDSSYLESFILNLYKDYFYSIETTEEDVKKSAQYKQYFEREKARRSSPTFEAYLRSLETELEIWENEEEYVARIAQLTQKTNQFNLTTIRLTEGEVLRKIQSGNYKVFTAAVRDKFGDNGMVGVLLVRLENDQTAVIENFLMSCRVMGRFIEDSFVSYVENALKEQGVNTILAEYRPSQKNKPVETLYERLGYAVKQNTQEGTKFYSLSLEELPLRNGFCRVKGI